MLGRPEPVDGRPMASWTLMGVIGLIYILELTLTSSRAGFGVDWSLTRRPSLEVLIDLGASSGTSPELWRFVAACFLHGSLWHVGFNLVALYILGPIVERAYGPAGLITAFVVTGVGASAISAVGHVLGGRAAFGVGASGALCGLMGFIWIYARRVGGPFGEGLKQTMSRWLIATLLFGFLVPNVDNWAHGGGFVIGVGLGALLPRPQRVAGKRFRTLLLAAATCSIALVGASGIRAVQEVEASSHARRLETLRSRTTAVLRAVDEVGRGADEEALRDLRNGALALSAAPVEEPEVERLVRRIVARCLVVHLEVRSGGPRTAGSEGIAALVRELRERTGEPGPEG